MSKVSKKNNNDTMSKVIMGGTNDMALGARTLADSISVTVNIVPTAVEGKPLSVAELNKIRIGDGLGQWPSVTYGVETTKVSKTKAKPSKAKAGR